MVCDWAMQSPNPPGHINCAPGCHSGTSTALRPTSSGTFMTLKPNIEAVLPEYARIAHTWLTVSPSQANFLFVRLPEGVSGRFLRDRLLEHYGVMVRENSNKVGSTEQY